MLNPVFNVSIPKRVSEALKPSTNRNDRCFYCRHVSIPKRVSEALKHGNSSITSPIATGSFQSLKGFQRL